MSTFATPALIGAVFVVSGTLAGAEPVFTDAQWSAGAAQVAPSSAGAVQAPAHPPVSQSLWSITASLVFVVALAVLLGWLVKRLGVKRLTQPRSQHLEVVDSLSLSLKRSVSLVRIGDQLVLVGVAEQQLTNLGTFPASVLRNVAADSAPVSVAAAVSVSEPAPVDAAPASGGSQRASRVLNPDPAFQRMLAKFQERP